MNNERSAALYQRALNIAPGGVHSPVRSLAQVGQTPLFIESAHGATIRDADGHTYTDYCMSFGPLILGHRHPAIAQAATAALKDGWSFGTAERYSLELAELISERIPAAEQIRFVNSGTEAVMSAIRLARAATGRSKILKFSGCYHGHSDAMLIDAGSGMAGQASSDGITAGVIQDTLVAPLNDPEALRKIFAAAGQQIAAVIIEPLPANHGLLPQTNDYLQELAKLCKEHTSLLIFDEVISGFRLSFGGCLEQTGVKPDLITWGKIIGGGFPVGAFAGSKTLMQKIAPTGTVYQAGTLSANPLAMRTGIATLKRLLDGSAYEKLEHLGSRLETGLKGLKSLSMQRQGSIFWLCKQTTMTQPARSMADFTRYCPDNFPALFKHLLKHGIYLSPSPFEVNFLSTAHSEADIDRFIDACKSFASNCAD